MVSVKLIILAIFLAVVALASAHPRFFYLDDGELEESAVRLRRDAPEAKGYTRGHVGPVYTFVKTDPKANFKWGVRHRVGAQYGRR